MKIGEFVTVFTNGTEIHILNLYPYCHCLWLGCKDDLLSNDLFKTLKDYIIYEAYTINVSRFESRLTILVKEKLGGEL